MYGRSRFGKVYSQKVHVIYDTRFVNSWELPVEQMDVGTTRHEISNHLGNVLASITDRPVGLNSNAINGMLENFEPSLANIIDYCPFGMLIQAQNRKSEVYPSGFNGKENDNEIKGVGNSLDFGARMYDSRLASFLSTDPLFKEYPNLSPYNFSANNPIFFKDNDGKKIFIYYETGEKNKDGTNAVAAYEYKGKLALPDNEFVRQSAAALDEIAASPKVAGKLAFLVNTPDYNINVYESYQTVAWVNGYIDKDKKGNENFMVNKEQDISFNETLGLLEESSGKVNAPFINLMHELGHVYNAIKKPNEWFKRRENIYDSSSEDSKWTNEEEKYNTKENEWPIIEEKGGFKRQSHEAGGYSGVKKVKTTGSTSTELKNK